MISKNAVYTRVAQAIKASYSTAYVSSKRSRTPSAFPAVWIVEADTHPDLRSTTLDLSDSQRISMFEVQAFSNDQDQSVTQVDGIMAIAEQTFRSVGYVKLSQTPVDNVDETIYRVVARYRRIIGGGDTI